MSTTRSFLTDLVPILVLDSRYVKGINCSYLRLHRLTRFVTGMSPSDGQGKGVINGLHPGDLSTGQVGKENLLFLFFFSGDLFFFSFSSF
jgi:hypothetical protein